jgi:hypothetical protein
VQVSLDVRVTQASTDLRFAFVSLEDGRTPDYIVIRKLEHDFLQRMPVQGKVDMVRASSPKLTQDLTVINPRSRRIDCWHSPSVFFYY